MAWGLLVCEAADMEMATRPKTKACFRPSMMISMESIKIVKVRYTRLSGLVDPFYISSISNWRTRYVLGNIRGPLGK